MKRISVDLPKALFNLVSKTADNSHIHSGNRSSVVRQALDEFFLREIHAGRVAKSWGKADEK